MIPQDRVMGCWHAAGGMVLAWKAAKKAQVSEQAVFNWAKLKTRATQQGILPAMKTSDSRRDGGGKLIVTVDRNTAGLLSGSSRVAYPNEKDREVGVTRMQMMSWGSSQGLQALNFDAPGSLTFTALTGELRTKGPLYAAGLFANMQAHAIAITGVLSRTMTVTEVETAFPGSMAADGGQSEWVIYNDPAPGDAGGRKAISFRDFQSLFRLPGGEPGVLMSCRG